jgi:hypothetical protein
MRDPSLTDINFEKGGDEIAKRYFKTKFDFFKQIPQSS